MERSMPAARPHIIRLLLAQVGVDVEGGGNLAMAQGLTDGLDVCVICK